MKSISLIIAAYKNIEFLELVFRSIDNQTFKKFEVIVAQDDNDTGIQLFLEESRNRYTFPIHHVFQEDKGFRKNKIFNRAIHRATYDFLVFIDGDCILHPQFLYEYAKRAKSCVCLFGRRVRLDEQVTNKLIETGDFKYLSLLRLLFTKSTHIENGLYLPFYTPKKKKNILGCNFCVSKQDMITINGFDEDFETPLYGEDTDVKRRLEMIGVKMESTKYKAVQYHLYHRVGDRTIDWKISGDMYNRKLAEGLSYCWNGLEKKAE